MANYFEYFPKITYDTELATNIMVRSILKEMIKRNAVLFHPYIVTENDRPDIVSSKYYSDSLLVWLLYYANDMLDPHYDWVMDYTDFNRYVHKKYPTTTFALNSPYIRFVAATKTIECYHADTAADLFEFRKNFLQLKIDGSYNELNDGYYTVLRKEYDETNGILKLYVHESLTDEVENYNGALITARYTDPRISIHHYEDAFGNEIDIFAYAGLSEEVTFRIASVVSYEIGETVIGSVNGGTAVVVGQNETGDIVYTNGLTGFFESNEALEGVSSGASSVITSTEIGAGRQSVTVYDYEDNLNESKREIKIIDSLYADDIEDELRVIFK